MRDMQDFVFALRTTLRPRYVGFIAEKLEQRATLPGAHTFDRLTHGVGVARAQRVPVKELLPMAFAGSWLVNSRVPSSTFAQWAEPASQQAWLSLLDLIEQVRARDLRVDARVAHDLAALCPAERPSVGPITKVLACLSPSKVPLLSDAALAWLTGYDAPVHEADQQLALPSAFAPALLVFAEVTFALRELLQGFIGPIPGCPYLPEQVFDRLMWFESWGYRHFRDPAQGGWWRLIAEDLEAIVPVRAAFDPSLMASDGLWLHELAASPFRDAAEAALERARRQAAITPHHVLIDAA